MNLRELRELAGEAFGADARGVIRIQREQTQTPVQRHRSDD